VARIDKYDPYGGNFRAYLAADWLLADVGKPYGVGLDTNGFVVKGAGTTGVIGILVLTRDKYFDQDEPVDVMVNGEIMEFAGTAGNPGVDFGDAGSAYYALPATGVISLTVVGGVYVGHTVEASRLIAHVGARPLPAV
jgi:hypothetical protein